MNTETTRTKGSIWQIYWVGLFVATLGSAWLVFCAFLGYRQLANATDASSISTWLIVQTVCAAGLVFGGFMTMAGSSTFAAGFAVDFDHRRQFDDETVEETAALGISPESDFEQLMAGESISTSNEPEPFGPPKPFIMIRCRRCETLNSEHRATCTACDQPI